MNAIDSVLAKCPIIIIKLGAQGDNYAFIPEVIRRNTVLISLDAGTSKANWDNLRFRRQIFVKKVVAGDKAIKTFIERAWWGCSSILEVKGELVEKYGMTASYKEKSRTSVFPITVSDILKDNELESFDLLMTDLEGADLDIIRSCDDFLGKAIAVQCELRFEPFYEKEPFLHEAIDYLTGKGFRLVGLRPEYWKPVSKMRNSYPDGIPVWADCLMLKDLRFDGDPSTNTAILVKTIILLSLLGKKSLAAYLYEKHNKLLNQELIAELQEFVAPEGRLPQLIRKTLVLTSKLKSLLPHPIKRFLKKLLRLKGSDNVCDLAHYASPHDNV